MAKVTENSAEQPVAITHDGRPMTSYDIAYYRPFFDLQWEYLPWTNSSVYADSFTPVRLSNNTFFNSVVCRENEEKAIYRNCVDEYTIVGTTEKKLRFSFKTGFVAVSYLSSAVDSDTGYPLIPDNPSVIQAVTAYVKWKLAEWYQWVGRRGYTEIADRSYMLWQHYVKQANNYFKMPKGIDTYQNLLEQTHQLIPRFKRYYGYFGKLGREEDRRFKRSL